MATELFLLAAVFFSFYLYIKTKYPGTLLIAISGTCYIFQLTIVYILFFSLEWPGYMETIVNDINPVIITLLFALGFSRLTVFLTKQTQ